MASGIYEIRNKVNGKRYVGSAVDLEQRRKNHYACLRHSHHHNAHLQAAWNCYGEEVFEFKVLLCCGKESLLESEQRIIDRDWGNGVLYNLSPTAGSPLGRRLSDEHKRKISEAGKRRSPPTQETRKKIGDAHRGKTISEEQRRHLSKLKKGKPLSEEHKRKVVDALRGRRLSEETKQKIGDAHRGKTISKEQRQKLKDAWVVRKQKQAGKRVQES